MRAHIFAVLALGMPAHACLGIADVETSLPYKALGYLAKILLRSNGFHAHALLLRTAAVGARVMLLM